ncbi:methionine ABC transporter ATP-binding protein [Syntrophaceticus schinkii]|uniref:Methionine ABC transporter (ATP-binding protein) n=1 Tax=Syntrophaceticus schinkii TaxID=499207 RepID=A0A0B7MMF9_9FIRM|nr:methionine ABC transporter ATP-binding protein [Syntrophaceticus schinkii]CEO89156.1 methionine ABC transporter (ATP-binding protein) [Syntrophaceticus schinkii]
MIEVNNLTKIFYTPSQKIVALDDVSLYVEKGEIFGIIGLSGAGKSTLIRCINMLEKPTKGSVVIDGIEITALEPQELRSARQKIGMIFQHFNLLSSRNVFDNVIFPLEIAGVPRKNASKRVEELLDLVGLTDRANSYPSQLSGGQKQRVGIARALANSPKLLLSDEATSALDPQTTRSILDLLKDINRRFNLTILLITHDMNVIKETCDRVAVIDDSRIVEVGRVIDIFSNPQTATSRSFISNVINREIPDQLLQRPADQTSDIIKRVIRVSFIGESAGKPLISSMIKKFDVDANILYGNIDRIKDTPFGYLTLELTGTPDQVAEGLDYLNEHGLEVEGIEDV